MRAKVTNEEVATIFDELADRLRARKELIFKIRAYQKSATAIRELPVPVEQYRRDGHLRDIPGVGEAIAKKIADLLDTGSFKLLDELRGADAGKA